jgi:hypothetical protein
MMTTTRPEGHELEPPRSRGRSLRVSRSYLFVTTTRPEGHELEPPGSRGRSLRVSRSYLFETTTKPEGHELEPPGSRGRSLRVSRSYWFDDDDEARGSRGRISRGSRSTLAGLEVEARGSRPRIVLRRCPGARGSAACLSRLEVDPWGHRARAGSGPPVKPCRVAPHHDRFVVRGVAMKTDLDHLPAREREPIAAIASLIQASAPVEMIILFGSRSTRRYRGRCPGRSPRTSGSSSS